MCDFFIQFVQESQITSQKDMIEFNVIFSQFDQKGNPCPLTKEERDVTR